MCGISGWVAYQRDLTVEQQTAEAMTETMACRGPDAAGTWLHRHAALGHRRLAIIDLPGGAQPMTAPTPDGDVCMVYSGETYNFGELRDELRRRGHEFRTDSDTEVVLHGFLEWGAEVAEKLNGMYAFAIYDTRDDKLALIRDRMGIKPLYYYPTEDGVLFGSEPKAILANPLATRVVDIEGFQELFGFVKTPGHAIWQGMHEVEPGTVVTVDRSGLRTHTYWTLPAVAHTDDQDTSIARVRELMDDIVRRQLISDVPRCVLLSGGLDSSAITGLAAAQLAERGEKVRSFAVDFLGQTENFVPDAMRGTPDTPFVHDVAEHVGTEHRDIVLDPATLADPAVRRAVITARDFPAGLGDLDQSLYLLFKAVREQSTVALSGESADEVFGGYKWFHDPAVQQAEMFPWIASAVINQQVDLNGSAFNPGFSRTLNLAQYLPDRYQQAVAKVPVLDGEDAFDATMRRICYLHLTHFVRILLDRKDRMSMATGLEVRVPFCDHRLVEYVFNTPWSLKTFDGREKSLLRHATKHVLPQSVVERVKSPYPSTQDPRYGAELQQQAKGVLADDSPVLEIFDRTWLDVVLAQDPKSMTTMARNSLERLLDVHVWLDIYRPELRLS